MAPSKLFALFIFAAVTVVQSQSPTPQTASNDCGFIKADSFQDMLIDIDTCTFPAYKINASCLSKSCPEILNEAVCSNGNDQENLKTDIQVIKKCLKKPKICGIDINPDHIPDLTFAASQLFTGTGFTGPCWVDDNNSDIYNLDGTQLSLIKAAASSPSPFMVQSQDEAIYNGTFSCNITNPFLNDIMNGTQYFLLKNIPYNVLVNFTSSSVDDLNDQQDPVKASNSKVSPRIGKFGLNENWPFLNTRQVFEQMVQNFIQESRMAKAYGEFMAAITGNVFEIAEEKC